MKDFLENYGFAILASIVVILLIAMATPVGNLVKTQVSSIVESFAYRVNNKIDAVFVTEESPIAVVMLDSPNSPVNGSENVTFRSSAPLSEFIEVRVDDNIVDPANYDLTEGSTIVEFHADYILTLGEGIHNVEIISEKGTATSNLERELRNGLINDLYYVDDELFTGEVDGDVYKNGLKIELITFSYKVNNNLIIPFQAEEGMTWGEWVESDYNNTSNYEYIAFYTVDGGTSSPIFTDKNHNYGSWLAYPESNSNVNSEHLIEENRTYADFMQCFPMGTQVLMADYTTKNIEDVKIGEELISYNPITNEFYEAVVGGLSIKENKKDLYNVELTNGTILTLTGNHPICVEGGTFKTVEGTEDYPEILAVGDRVVTIDGIYEVTNISIEPYKHEYSLVYNINVIDKDETYENDYKVYDTFVANGVVVHNY